MLSVESYLGKKQYECVCECGKKKVVRGADLKRGSVKSCGSHSKGKSGNVKHGMTGTRIYNIYKGIKLRCNNINDPTYPRYGGRGIRVCPEWLGEDGFANFHKWSLDNGYSDSLSIDRIDVDGNYEPSNCRWATEKQQGNNRRNSLYFTYNGEIKTLKQWCDKLGLKYNTVWKRINKFNYSFERAIGHDITKVEVDKGV